MTNVQKVGTRNGFHQTLEANAAGKASRSLLAVPQQAIWHPAERGFPFSLNRNTLSSSCYFIVSIQQNKLKSSLN